MSSASLSVSASRLIPATTTYPRHADDYYDINDILASDSKVPCVFEMQVLRLGFLVPGTSVENIAIGTKMDLPYWLARALCSKRKQIVSVDIPKAYKDTYREVMRADANVVNLQKLGPYYYCTGVKLLNFELQETEALSRTLVEAFLNRFRKIMDSSQNCLKVDTSELMMKLDDTEKRLFAAGKRSVMEFDKWLKQRCYKIEVSSITHNLRKRRRPPSEGTDE